MWAFLSAVVLVYACQKDFRHDDETTGPKTDPAAVSRATQAEIAAFIDSIPDAFINRQQRVLALMTYEEIKRRNPAVSNYGRPLWPATHTLPQQPGGTRLSLTPIVVTQDGQVESAAILAVETDSADCRYWVFTPTAPDSLLSASDRDGETVNGLSTCYQDCLGCPPPCGPPPTMLDKFNCLIGCLLSLGGWEPFSSAVNIEGTDWQFYLSGSTPTRGFTNQAFLHNGNENGNNTGNNNGGGGNGNLSNYNFTQTAYDVYDKYYDCLQAHPEISTAVWNKLYTPDGTAHCLSPFIDEALGMLCGEAQGQSISAAQFEEEFERAVQNFFEIMQIEVLEEFDLCPELENYLSASFYAKPPLTEPITDRKAALDACFGTSCTNCTYSITLFIDQPNPGTRDITNGARVSGSSFGSAYAGHTFFQLSQTNSSGVTTTKAIGFYPIEFPKGDTDKLGYFYNEDANTEYNISVTYSLTAQQFANVRSTIENIYYFFKLVSNNCTTSAIAVLNSAGLNIPSTHRYAFPVGTIYANPADLGEDLRSNPHGGQFTSFSTPQKFTPASCQ